MGLIAANHSVTPDLIRGPAQSFSRALAGPRIRSGVTGDLLGGLKNRGMVEPRGS